jgi:hypothetical protein
MGFSRSSGRRIPGGDELARALLDAGEPLSFDALLAAAPGASPGEVAAWVGHAIEEGLLWSGEPGSGYTLRARGRRLLGARRRAAERQPSA